MPSDVVWFQRQNPTTVFGPAFLLSFIHNSFELGMLWNNFLNFNKLYIRKLYILEKLHVRKLINFALFLYYNTSLFFCTENYLKLHKKKEENNGLHDYTIPI